MHSTPFDYILTDKKTHHDPDMNNTSCQILRATRVQTATTRIGEGAHDTCLLKHQCASSASQRVKENNRSFAQRWLEKTERPEPLTVCSTLGCRCAFHGYSCHVQSLPPSLQPHQPKIDSRTAVLHDVWLCSFFQISHKKHS